MIISELQEALKNSERIKIPSGKTIDLFERFSIIKKDSEIWLSGLNKNGFDHSERLENYLNLLTKDLLKQEKISPVEIFILLSATYLHDIGYKKNYDVVSKDHAKRSQEMILENPERYQLGDFPKFNEKYPRIAEAIGLVCLGHYIDLNNDIFDTIPDEFQDHVFGNDYINLRKLTALLRLADEADDPYIRSAPSIQSIRSKFSLVSINGNTIIWHWDKAKEKDPLIFEQYRKEKISNLESSTHYLRSIGAGFWFVVLQPEINFHDIEINKLKLNSDSQNIGILLKSIDIKLTNLIQKISGENNSITPKEIVNKNIELENTIDESAVLIIGCGNAGSITINRIFHMGISGAETIAVSSNKKMLDMINAEKRVLIGKSLTKGRGSGGNPDIGKVAAVTAIPTINALIGMREVVFIVAGMGGGTGSGAAPVIAKVAKESGSIVIGFVTYPHEMEKTHLEIAKNGITQLASNANCVIVLDFNLIKNFIPSLPFGEAFSVMDQIIAETIKSISECITEPSLINLKPQDLRIIMSKVGVAILLFGESNRYNRIESVVNDCLNNKLSMRDHKNAKGCLIHITGGSDLTLHEAEEISKQLTKDLDPSADVIWCAKVRNDMEGKLKVIAVITGLEE